MATLQQLYNGFFKILDVADSFDTLHKSES